MKKEMKRILSYFLYAIPLLCIVLACDDHIDIKQDYGFEVTCLPVPKKLKKGETAEMRFQIVREGYYAGTGYRMRFFQFDGKGSLTFENGTGELLPNDYYPLENEIFKMFYTSGSEEAQAFTLYFFDNMGNSRTMAFLFNADTSEEEEEEL